MSDQEQPKEIRTHDWFVSSGGGFVLAVVRASLFFEGSVVLAFLAWVVSSLGLPALMKMGHELQGQEDKNEEEDTARSGRKNEGNTHTGTVGAFWWKRVRPAPL